MNNAPLAAAAGKLAGGESSRLEETQLSVDDAGWVHFAGIVHGQIHARDLRFGPRVGNASRLLTLPDGRAFESRDQAALAAIEQRWGRPDPLHQLESRKRWILGLALASVLLGALLIRYLIPLAAQGIARQLPISSTSQLAAGLMAQLDERYFQASSLPEARQRHYQALFAELTDAQPQWRWRLLFRQGQQLGANALALPDGSIVITDELIALATSDAEIQGVLLHEIGHVVERHALRTLLEGVGLSLVYLWVAGDASGINDTLAGLPVLLLQLHYSRRHESEADDYALQTMPHHGLPPAAFAELMDKLAASHTSGDNSRSAAGDGADRQQPPQWLDYLSSHPRADERAARFRQPPD